MPLILFACTLLITCEKIDRDNPWDAKAGLDPNSWAPHNLEIELASITERKLTWQYGDHNIEGFKVDRKEGDGEWEEAFAVLDKDSRIWDDTETQLDEWLSYRLYAFAGNNTSAFKEAEYIPLSLTTHEATNITQTSALLGGEVDGSHVDSHGIAYSTSPNPDISGNTVPSGSGAGSFTAEMTDLNPETEYYVRAYASNNVGTTYGNQVMFETAPTYDDTEIVDVLNPETGKTWMDRNLGASRAAISSTDEEAYGDLYQWGRAFDGHQKRNSGTTSTLSSSDFPGHGSFITVNSSPYDWRSPQNDDLWQGVSGVNNPCPDGYRLPTEAEWEHERQSWSSNNAEGAFASPLKLPVAGSRGYSSGSLAGVGSFGYYWSSAVGGSHSRYLFFYSAGANTGSDYRAGGGSVRCLKD